MKISNPGKYVVETVRDEHYYSHYYCSHLGLSGRRFFGFPYAIFLARDLLKHAFLCLSGHYNGFVLLLKLSRRFARKTVKRI